MLAWVILADILLHYSHVTLGLLLIGLLVWMLSPCSNSTSKRLPPGSMGLPFIGESLGFLKSMISNKPWEFYLSREAKYGKVFKTSLFGSSLVCIAPPEGSRLLFNNHNTLVSKAVILPTTKLLSYNTLLLTDGNEAKAFRQVLQAFLGPEFLQTHLVSTSRLIQNHLDKHWSSDNVTAYPLIQECLFAVACQMYLGITDSFEVKQLMEPFQKVIRGLVCLPVDVPWTTFHQAKCGREKIFQLLDKYITKRRQGSQERLSNMKDLLSSFLTNDHEGKLMSDNHIKDDILGLLLAGHEPTGSSLAMTIRCLAENPDCFNELKKVHYEIQASKKPGEDLTWDDLKRMKYTWRVIQESMRLRPTAAAVIRKSLVEFEIGEFTIPKGWLLFSTVYSSHMNHEYFPNPGDFDPSRFEGTGPAPYTYFPFGGGPRICLGIELAKMQNLLFLHHMITRFSWTLVEPDEPIELIPMAAPAHNLPLKLLTNN